MQPLCNQRTTGEETLACLHEIRVSGTRVHAPGRHDAAAPRAAMLRQSVRAVGRSVVVACLAIIGAVHAASNVVQYTHDAAGNIVAIRRVNPSPITIAGFAPPSGPTGTVVTITGTGFGATPTDQRGHVQWRCRNGRCGNEHHTHRGGADGRRHGQDRGSGRRQHRDQRPGFRRRRAGRPDDRRIHAGGWPARYGSDRHRNGLQCRARRHDGQAESECRDHILGHDDATRVRRSTRHRLRQDPRRDNCGQRCQCSGLRRATRVDRGERHHHCDQAFRERAGARPRPLCGRQVWCRSVRWQRGRLAQPPVSQLRGQSGERDDCVHDLQAGQHPARERQAVGRKPLDPSAGVAGCRHLYDAARHGHRAGLARREAREQRFRPRRRDDTGRRSECRAIHARADRGGGRRSENADGVGLDHRSRRQSARLYGRLSEWHHVPHGERKRARLHDATAAVHGDGHACRGFHGEHDNDAVRLQGRLPCGCRLADRRRSRRPCARESRRGCAAQHCRSCRTESGTRHHGTRPQPGNFHIREHCGAQAGRRVARGGQLSRGWQRMRGQSDESSRHRHLQRHRAAGERRDGIPAGVAFARCCRGIGKRHAVPTDAGASRPECATHLPGGGRRADRTPGARRRDEPRGAGTFHHDQQARWLVADLLPLDRRRADPGRAATAGHWNVHGLSGARIGRQGCSHRNDGSAARPRAEPCRRWPDDPTRRSRSAAEAHATRLPERQARTWASASAIWR